MVLIKENTHLLCKRKIVAKIILRTQTVISRSKMVIFCVLHPTKKLFNE